MNTTSSVARPNRSSSASVSNRVNAAGRSFALDVLERNSEHVVQHIGVLLEPTSEVVGLMLPDLTQWDASDLVDS